VYIYLKCSHHHKNCTQKAAPETALINQIQEEVFSGLSVSDTELEMIKDTVRDELQQKSAHLITTRCTTETNLKNLEATSGRFLDLYIDGNLSKNDYELKKAEIETESKNLNILLEKRSKIDGDISKMAESVINITVNAGKIFESSKAEQKQRFLSLLVSNCTMDNKKLRFSLNFPFAHMQEMAKIGKWLTSLYNSRTLMAEIRDYFEMFPEIIKLII
jgi:hypothetical protein